MLLKLKTLKSTADCEEFLFTLMKKPFQNECVRRFNTWKFPLPRKGELSDTIHAGFTENAENPFDLVIRIKDERIHTNSFLEAVGIIFINRKRINRGIVNYNT